VRLPLHPFQLVFLLLLLLLLWCNQMACCCPSQTSMPSSSTDLLLLASCLRYSQSSTLFLNLVVPTMVILLPNPVGQVIVVGTHIHEQFFSLSNTTCSIL
ncbi:hypothetical protein JOM56_004204, partial [Amanita muscaria]